MSNLISEILIIHILFIRSQFR